MKSCRPGTSRQLGKDPDAEGFYPVTLDTGEVIAQLELFDDTLIEHANALIHLLQAPFSLANALGAAGRREAPGREGDQTEKSTLKLTRRAS